MSRALHYILTAERFTGKDAFEIGLVTKLFSKESIEEDTMKFAEDLATRIAPVSAAIAKRLVNKRSEMSMDNGLEMESMAMGILYGALFGEPIHTFLPYVATGLLIWNFVNGCILEGSEVFIANEGLIRFLPAPISLHVYRLLWRQTLFFVHNLAVYLVMVTVFWSYLDVNWSVLLAIPAFGLLMLNGGWVALLVGIVSTRFRDIPPVTQSVVTLMFFMTPIVWVYDQLLADPRTAPRAKFVELNPFLHYVEINRRPMLGQSFEVKHWIVVGVITIVGWLLALVFMRNYRARVSYWV